MCHCKGADGAARGQELAAGVYGGMPIQLGWCNGHNTKLNCLEYHRDSELNLGSRDFILLVAKREDMEDGRLDTAKVQAFHCPAGVLVEVYATTLHYAPCSAKKGSGLPGSHRAPLGHQRSQAGDFPKMRRTAAFGPVTSGSWPTGRAARPPRALRCSWRGVNLDIGELLP